MAKKTNIDIEGDKLMTDADKVKLMVEGDAWAVVKGKLDAQILDLQNINNIDMTTPEAMAIDMKARMMAAKLLFAWLKNDIYGFIEQQEANNLIAQKTQEGFIDRE